MDGMDEKLSLLLITFSLGGAWYAIEASQVQEVILVDGNTAVYHAPSYVRGIINLRGKIVTVLDLETKLGLPHHPMSIDSRILIVDWEHEQVGLLVTMVDDVITLNADQIDPVPMNLSERLSGYLSGVCGSADRLTGILDLAAVLAE